MPSAPSIPSLAPAFIFDFDGTLVDTERLQILAWEQIFQEYGIRDEQHALYRMIGRTSAESDSILEEHILRGRYSAPALRPLKNKIFDQMIERDIPLKPGAHEALMYLQSRQIPLAVASSSVRLRLTDRLQKSGLFQYFSVIVGGDDVEKGKPDPAIFLKTAAELRINPEECTVVEDSVYGVMAALAAGMKVIFIKDLVDLPQQLLQRVSVKQDLHDLCS